ncbi:MAG: hypothetical protein P4L33_06835 [Capsulimonadaceae bacterium]|nr:hypothetical protein [Capsulimonadaceae bacterium]
MVDILFEWSSDPDSLLHLAAAASALDPRGCRLRDHCLGPIE